MMWKSAMNGVKLSLNDVKITSECCEKPKWCENHL